MSIEIIIKKGVIRTRRWSTRVRRYIEKRAKKQSFLPFLGFVIHEMTDTTFGQFMDLIRKDMKLFDIFYQSATMGHPLKEYFKEMDEEPHEKLEADKLECYWEGERFDKEVDIGIGFHAWGEWPEYEGKKQGKGGIAIEFTPLCQIKHLPLVLDEKFEIMLWAKHAGKKKSRKSKKPLYVNDKLGTRKFTVDDIISAILWEISFVGIPRQRDGHGKCEICKTDTQSKRQKKHVEKE